MLVEASHGFVERNRWQSARIDVAHEILAVLQMLVAVGGAGSKAGEVVQRLVMRLEIDRVVLAGVDYRTLLRRRPHSVSEGRVPTARVPGPADAFCRERVADRLAPLRWQGKAQPLGTFSIGQVQRTALARRDPARLVWRLRRVDGEAIRRDLPAQSARVGLDRPVSCRWRARLLLELAVGIEAGLHLWRGVLKDGRARADQVLMVEIGAAERAHEEVVGQSELLGPLPQLQSAAVKIAHGVAANGRHGREHVVAAAVDLLDAVIV